jgi:hypothetical protein
VFTRDNILAGVEQSLVPMKTGYLDLVQFHISTSKQTLAENGAFDAVLELKEAGKGAVHWHVRDPATPEKPYRNGGVRRVSNPLLGEGTRTRGDHRNRGGGGRRHPWRSRANPDPDTTIVGIVNPAHLGANVEVLLQGPPSAGSVCLSEAPPDRRWLGTAV